MVHSLTLLLHSLTLLETVKVKKQANHSPNQRVSRAWSCPLLPSLATGQSDFPYLNHVMNSNNTQGKWTSNGRWEVKRFPTHSSPVRVSVSWFFLVLYFPGFRLVPGQSYFTYRISKRWIQNPGRMIHYHLIVSSKLEVNWETEHGGMRQESQLLMKRELKCTEGGE